VFWVKKIVSAFLLPPGCFILILALGGVWLLVYRRRTRNGMLTLATALLLWLASTPLVAGMVVSRLERGLDFPREVKGDVIILLGGGVSDDVKDLTGRGCPSDDMMGRIVMAVRVQRLTGLPILVSGGPAPLTATAESWVVRRFLTDLGVPPGKVIVEDKSRDTDENARFVEEICTQRGFRNPLLVTSAYHMKRSMLTFQRYGLSVVPMPAGFHSPDQHRFNLYLLLPTSTALELTTAAFHEFLGIIYYRRTLPEANWPGQ